MADVVYMARHAAPPPDRRDRYWGRGDPGVDPDSLALVPSLSGLMWTRPARAATSPLGRSRATAEALCRALGLRPEADADLAEADFGLLDGLTFPEIASRYPDAAREWAEKGDAFSFPGGESVSGFLDRAERAWRRYAEAPEASVVAVTHGGVIACWCCLFLGLPPARRFAFRPAWAALTAFVRKKDGSGWEMAFFNNEA